ncbi:MAG: hypothetical protein ACTHMM_10090 [Agriterribacter sp.]
MIDPGKYIRKAFFSALDGHVIYDGKVIPVFDTFSDEDEGKFQIMLTNQTGSNTSDKQHFTGDHTLVIDIVTKTKGSGNKEIADNIAEQITQIIQPTRTTTGLTIDTPFQLLNLRLQNSSYLEEGTKSHFIVRKLLTYAFRIVQN